MHPSRIAVLMAAAGLLVAPSTGCGSRSTVRIEHAWVRGADSAATTAAYFTIVNDRTDTLHVTGIAGDVAEATTLHETVHEGAMVAMRETGRVDVAPHARVEFRPGGHHVMLSGLRRPLRPGMHVNLVLHASGWPEVPIVAEVR